MNGRQVLISLAPDAYYLRQNYFSFLSGRRWVWIVQNYSINFISWYVRYSSTGRVARKPRQIFNFIAFAISQVERDVQITKCINTRKWRELWGKRSQGRGQVKLARGGSCLWWQRTCERIWSESGAKQGSMSWEHLIRETVLRRQHEAALGHCVDALEEPIDRWVSSFRPWVQRAVPPRYLFVMLCRQLTPTDMASQGRDTCFLEISGTTRILRLVNSALRDPTFL